MGIKLICMYLLIFSRVKVRRLIALPMLRKNDIKMAWHFLKTFPNSANLEDALRNEISLLAFYLERNWLRKVDSGNLFSFNKLIRVRNTNAAESWHSLMKR